MKIVFFIRSLANGGAERQLSFLASGLQKNGHSVIVLTYYAEENISNNINYVRLIENGVTVKSINKKGRYDLFGFLKRFLYAIRLEKPDIIYSFLELSNIIACLAKFIDKNIKIVWGKRSSDLELKRYNLSLRFEHYFEKLLSAIPDLIIANSQQGKKYLMMHRYKSPIHVVHNGFELINNDNFKKEGFLQALYPVILNQTIIGAVGRIDYAKDYDILIKAFSLVVERCDSVILLIVGRIVQFDYYQSLIKLIKLNGLESKVIFVPEMSSVTKFYQDIDIFVSSSYTEGFSNVIAEAMLSGLPCVVTDAGDNSTLVKTAGIVVERRNSVVLAEGILTMLEDKDRRKYYGALAKSRIIANFSLSNLIQNTEHCLKNLYEN